LFPLDYLKAKNFLDRNSTSFINFKALHDEFFQLATHFCLDLAARHWDAYVLSEGFFRLTIGEGSFSMQKLVDEHPKGPNIGLRAIDIVDKCFWGHIQRSSYVRVLKLLPLDLGEPEISNLRTAIVDQYIAGLDVSVNYSLLVEITKAICNLTDIFYYFGLDKPLLGSQFARKVALVAELGHDVAVLLAHEDLMALENIRVVELFEKGEFVLPELREFVGVDACEFDDFDGIEFFC
jgi:hypothetical protein